MRLKELLEKSKIEVLNFPDENPEIKNLAYNSKKVKQNTLFFAIKGTHHDGKNFIPEAVKKGACAVVVDKKLDHKIPQVIVRDVKVAMAYIAEAFFDFPSKKLTLTGITGTNGKTTISFMLEEISKKAGHLPARFGTISYKWGMREIKFPNTTAESLDISRCLWEFEKDGGKNVFLEVSSQGLDRKCAEALFFKAAVFTNLNPEHLDWHKTMENYALSKRHLFKLLSKNKDGIAILNKNDPWSEKFIKDIPVKVKTYGTVKSADYYGEINSISDLGTQFTIKFNGNEIKISLKLIGEFNVLNALAAFSCASEFGISPDVIKHALENFEGVTGRLTKFVSKGGFVVFVDYAHTPFALENVLKTLKELNPQRLIVVFGCGGNRDREKRPLMGKIASEFSDFIWVTTDNPRDEEPKDIALDIEVGIRQREFENYRIELDRKKAIQNALTMAQKGDIILIAGKGHEDYQIIKDKKIHLSDIEIVKNFLKGG